MHGVVERRAAHRHAGAVEWYGDRHAELSVRPDAREGALTYTRGTKRRGDDAVFGVIGESTGLLGQFLVRSRGTVAGEGIGSVNYLPGEQTMNACVENALSRISYELTTQTIVPFAN